MKRRAKKARCAFKVEDYNHPPRTFTTLQGAVQHARVSSRASKRESVVEKVCGRRVVFVGACNRGTCDLGLRKPVRRRRK